MHDLHGSGALKPDLKRQRALMQQQRKTVCRSSTERGSGRDKLRAVTINSVVHEVRTAQQTPELKNFFLAQAIDVSNGSPQQFGDFIKAETERWGEVIRRAKIKVD